METDSWDHDNRPDGERLVDHSYASHQRYTVELVTHDKDADDESYQ